MWNNGSFVPLLLWAFINKTLMLDLFPAVSATAPLYSSMVDSVLQSNRHQFLREVLSSFQFMFYYNYIKLLVWVQVLYKIWKTLIWFLFWALTNKCTFMFWQTSIIDEIINDLISLINLSYITIISNYYLYFKSFTRYGKHHLTLVLGFD